VGAVYKPIGLLLGILAGMVGRKVFDFVWSKFDEEKAPKPTTKNAPLPKILGAAAIQGLIFRVVKTGVDRAGARGFEHLTGVWPGEQYPERE
jgi:hypothetical protein